MSIKKRNSNIELLRICAMLMIITYHIVAHCVNVQLTDTGSIERMGNDLFNQPVFYKRLLIPAFIMPWGIVGNALFIMISGYFMVAKKEKIDIKKISQKLLLQLGFVATILVLVSTFCYQKIKGIDFNLIRIWDFNDMSWFVGYYFLVMLCAKLFLNKLLDKLDKSQYLTFLIGCFALIQLRWARTLADGLTAGLSILITGIFLYSLGGYIRKYNPFERIRGCVFVLVILVIYVLLYLSNYNTVINKIQDYIRSGSTDAFRPSIQEFGNYSIVVILMGICLFELFSRLHIPQNKLINYFGAATFMTYLMHDNTFIYSIWNTQDWVTLLYNSPLEFCLKIELWALMFLGCGVVLYSLYIGLEKLYGRYKYIFLK